MPKSELHAERTARSPGVDGLRGTVFLVMLVHFNTIRYAPTAFLEKIYFLFVQYGLLGLDVFFVVSGFLITGILLDTKGSKTFFKTFYIRRTLRIFPLYYGFLILRFIIWPALDAALQHTPASTQVWYWTYIFNIYVAIHGDGHLPMNTIHLWSLAVEEQFYLLWPAVVHLCSRTRLLRITAACLVIAPLLRAAFVALHAPMAAFMLMPSRMDSLAAGAMIAILYRQPGGLTAAVRWARPAAIAALVIVTAMFIRIAAIDVSSRLYLTVGLEMSLVLASAVVVLAVTRNLGRLGDLLDSRPFMRLGLYSYAIYVLHDPLEMFMNLRGFTFEAVQRIIPQFLPAQLLYTAILMVLSVALSALSWELFEKHFLKLKSRFRYAPAEIETTGLAAP